MAFDPQNDLERSLMRAATDPAHRPQFYRDFLDAEIYIIEYGERPQREQRRTLPAGYQLKLAPITAPNGKSYLPVFSSLCRLQAVLREEAGYLAMPARDFLTTTRGADVFLNPGSDYGKEFLSQEVAGMLDGSIWKPQNSWQAQQETKILLGQPARYPHELVAALTHVFATLPGVKRAYLAHFHNSARNEPPHTLIAIDVDGDWDRVAGDAGVVCSNVQVPDPPVDFVRIGQGQRSGFEGYFHTIRPFYERTVPAAPVEPAGEVQPSPPATPNDGSQAPKTQKPWWRLWG